MMSELEASYADGTAGCTGYISQPADHGTTGTLMHEGNTCPVHEADGVVLQSLLLALCDAFLMEPERWTHSEAVEIRDAYRHCGMDAIAGQWADAWNRAEAANVADDSGDRI
jgi:hypothetical protein